MTLDSSFQDGSVGTIHLNDGSYSGTQNNNGSSSDFSVGTSYGDFSTTLISGIIAIIIALMAVGAIAGIRVLGSGISDTSVKIIYNSVLFYAIWGILSVFTLNGLDADGLLSIPFGVGIWIWFIMTLLYSLGIVQQINSTGSIGGS